MNINTVRRLIHIGGSERRAAADAGGDDGSLRQELPGGGLRLDGGPLTASQVSRCLTD